MAMPLLGEEPLFVSLGSHCEPAVMIREKQLRKAAFPFDWLLTLNHEGFLSVLETDFQYFSDENCLFKNPVHPQILDNSVYKIEYSHDWPFADSVIGEERTKSQIAQMKLKYQRRIDRFRDLRNYPGKVFFIRSAFEIMNGHYPYGAEPGKEAIDRNQAEEIYSALERYFLDLDFTLVIVNYKEEDPHDFDSDRILDFTVRKDHRNEDYYLILNMLCELDGFNKCFNF